MKTNSMIETKTSEAGELLFLDDNCDEKPITSLDDLKEATRNAILYLKECVEADLEDIWKRLDQVDHARGKD